MVSKKPYLWAIAALVLLSSGIRFHSLDSSHDLSDNGNLVFNSEAALPDNLLKRDRELYSAIFAAQEKADWKSADESIGKLESPLLLGYVLAERYLHKGYTSQAAELTDWLNIYSDHPQAYEIAALAGRKSGKPELYSHIKKTQSLQGYGDDNGLAASFGDSHHALTWNKALKEWRKGSKLDAAKLFASMLEDKELPQWKVSASAYWAYRGYLAANRTQEADKYLKIAASKPRSFYGILARQKLKLPLELDTKPAVLSTSDMEEMTTQPAVQRVIALNQLGKSELAEKELRVLFPQASEAQKTRLLALARQLGIASVQIAMAKQLGSEERPLDYARYPVPAWQPNNGFKIDRALLYALVRQESGFRASAVSPSGASGLMQIMPQTASYMKKRMYGGVADLGLISTIYNEKDPMFNMALGQDYVKHLLENELVEGNMLYMLTAYNAGPGRLQDWKNSIDYNNDPLLFIESIPFAETRHYVMQVMTNYWIYSELAGNPNPSVVAVMSGKWPDYNIHAAPIAVGTIQAILENAG